MATEPDNDHVWHDLVLDAVVAAVAALEIGRGAEGRVQKVITFETAGLIKMRPVVLATIDDSRVTCVPFSTEEDERVLPVMVAYLDRKDRKNNAALPAWLKTYQQLINAFLMQLLPSVTSCWHVEVNPVSLRDAEFAKGPGMEDAVGLIELVPRIITERVRPET